MQMLRRAVPSIGLLLVIAILGACGQSVQNNEAQSSDFNRLNADVKQMEATGVLSVEKQQVQFDKEAALADGYSQASIELAAELASYSNELVDKSREASEGDAANIDPLAVETTNYPAVEAHFDAATSSLNSAEASENIDTQQLGNGRICGDYDNPLPRSGGPRRIITTSNPEAALRSKGYHATPTLAFGGGWTLPKTYLSRCGDGTYRWHGIVRSDGYSEQYYTGSPPGEPNPEFFRSFRWPYPTWPAYVRWWHQNF